LSGENRPVSVKLAGFRILKRPRNTLSPKGILFTGEHRNDLRRRSLEDPRRGCQLRPFWFDAVQPPKQTGVDLPLRMGK
jgi:hypothetical protein